MSRPTAVPQTAAATGTTQRLAGPPASVTRDTGPVPGTTSAVSWRASRGRRLALVASALTAGVVVAAVLAGAMSDAIASRAAEREAQATNDRVAAQVEAGRREVDFAQTPAFLGFTARSFGYGRGKERQFALQAGAPPPDAIVPLGSTPASSTSTDPLDTVMELLFER